MCLLKLLLEHSDSGLIPISCKVVVVLLGKIVGCYWKVIPKLIYLLANRISLPTVIIPDHAEQ
jgi:hypothetical protein